MPKMVTIKQAIPRLADDGMPMSEYSLRLLVKRGAIPVRYLGNKALIFYPNIVSYLQCIDGRDNPPLEM